MKLMFKAFNEANRNHRVLIDNMEAGEQLCRSELECEQVRNLAERVMEVLAVFTDLYLIVGPGLDAFRGLY